MFKPGDASTIFKTTAISQRFSQKIMYNLTITFFYIYYVLYKYQFHFQSNQSTRQAITLKKNIYYKSANKYITVHYLQN